MIHPIDPLGAIQAALMPYLEQAKQEKAALEAKIADLMKQITKVNETNSELIATNSRLLVQVKDLEQAKLTLQAQNLALQNTIEASRGITQEIDRLRFENNTLQDQIEQLQADRQEIHALRDQNRALTHKIRQAAEILVQSDPSEGSDEEIDANNSGIEPRELALAVEIPEEHVGAIAEDRRLQKVNEQLEEHPNDPNLHFSLGFHHVRLGNYKEAIPVFTQASEKGFDGWQLEYFEAIARRELGQYKEALDCIDISIQSAPAEMAGNALYVKATICLRSGNKDAVKELLPELRSQNINTQAIEAALAR